MWTSVDTKLIVSSFRSYLIRLLSGRKMFLLVCFQDAVGKMSLGQKVGHHFRDDSMD